MDKREKIGKEWGGLLVEYLAARERSGYKVVVNNDKMGIRVAFE